MHEKNVPYSSHVAWRNQAVRKKGQRSRKKWETLFVKKGSCNNISSFVSLIDDFGDGWYSAALCGIVLSRPAWRLRGGHLSSQGLCIEQGARVVRMDEKRGGWVGMEGEQRVESPFDKTGDGLITLEADREPSPPWRRRELIPMQRLKDSPEKQKKERTFVSQSWGEIVLRGDFSVTAWFWCCWPLASRWPRLVQPSLGLGWGHCLVGTLAWIQRD